VLSTTPASASLGLGIARGARRLRVESAHVGFDATTVENSSVALAERPAGGHLRALLVSAAPTAEHKAPVLLLLRWRKPIVEAEHWDSPQTK
jgi:hypothetical protein